MNPGNWVHSAKKNEPSAVVLAFGFFRQNSILEKGKTPVFFSTTAFIYHHWNPYRSLTRLIPVLPERRME